jgi:hypothetical protein
MTENKGDAMEGEERPDGAVRPDSGASASLGNLTLTEGCRVDPGAGREHVDDSGEAIADYKAALQRRIGAVRSPGDH